MQNITQYQFFQKLCALTFVDAIYLYGSRARGDHKERSDIDLAIVCPNATQDDWLTIIGIIEDADTLLKKAIWNTFFSNNYMRFKFRGEFTNFFTICSTEFIGFECFFI